MYNPQNGTGSPFKSMPSLHCDPLLWALPFAGLPPPFRWIASNPCLKVSPMDPRSADPVDAMIEHFCLCSSKVWKSQFTGEHWTVKIPIWGGRGGRRALDVVNPKNPKLEEIFCDFIFQNISSIFRSLT